MADIDAFIRAPSQEALGNFSMEQLLVIAEHFSVEVVGDKRLKSTIKASIVSALSKTGVFPAEKEGVVKPLLQASSLSFEQQKEMLLLQLSHDKMRYEMEFEKEIAVERMRQETEKAKIDMEGQRLSMGRDGAVLGSEGALEIYLCLGEVEGLLMLGHWGWIQRKWLGRNLRILVTIVVRKAIGNRIVRCLEQNPREEDLWVNQLRSLLL
ncbi:hypothetical protein NQZ68_025870 [Dissostichus eleginoides]|nr:hypothetical protein NQZ68_025870 [Dissostichus eleginoides]